MIGREDIESWLIRTELDFEEIEQGMWMVRPEPAEGSSEAPPVVISHQPPVLLFRAAIRPAPEDDDERRLELFGRLLELNANDLVHGSYGLEDGEIVLTDTLELETLDFEEFRASLESLALAVTSHAPDLLKDG